MYSAISASFSKHSVAVIFFPRYSLIAFSSPLSPLSRLCRFPVVTIGMRSAATTQLGKDVPSARL